MGGFFGGLAAGLGGAGQAAQQYGQQQRQIEAQKNLFNMQIWNESRNKIADELAAQKNEQQGDRYVALDSLEKKVRLARPGDDLTKLMGDVQAHTTIHPTSIQAMQGAGLIPSEVPPPKLQPGPGNPVTGLTPVPMAQSTPQPQGTLSQMIASAGAEPQAQTQIAPPLAAQPSTNPTTSTSGPILPAGQSIVPGIVGARNLLTQPSQPSSAQGDSSQDQQPAKFDAMQFFPLSENDKVVDSMYKQGFLQGHVAPQVAAAYADLQKRREEFAGGFAKAEATFAQNMAHAPTLGIDPSKLAVEQRSEFAHTGEIKPLPLMNPGQAQMSVTGQEIARSPIAKIEFGPEGSTPFAEGGGPTPASSLTPQPTGIPVGPTPLPGASAQLPGITGLPTLPPKLSVPETRATSAALQTAKKYNVPFDPNFNPHNPMAQLPWQYQSEASGLAKVMDEDPDARADRLRLNGILEALRNTQVLLAQTQLGTIPSASDYQLMAKSIVDHTLSPDELRSLRSGGMRGWNPAKIFTETKAIDPNFSWEKAENEYKAMATTERSFAGGPSANIVRANNVALEHLGMLDEAREALNNGNIPALNSIANQIGLELGKTGKTTFDTIAQAVGKEVNKAFIPGGGSSRERLAESNDFSSSKGDNQIKNNIKATVELMSAQQRGLEKQYHDGTYGQGTLSLWSPEALATRERLNPTLRAIPTTGPPQSLVDAAKEGQYIHSADGSASWKKVNGKAVPQPLTVH